MKRFIWAVVLSLACRPVAVGEEKGTDARREAGQAIPAIVEIEVLLAEWNVPVGEGGSVKESLSGTAEQAAERVAALERAGKLSVVQRFRLTTVDGHSASAQQGERRPQLVGVTATPRGNANNINFLSVGTLVSVVPTVQEGNVLLSLELERSGVKTRPDAPILAEPPMGEKIRAESVTTLQLKSMVRIPSGQTVILAGLAVSDERQIALVTANVVK